MKWSCATIFCVSKMSGCLESFGNHGLYAKFYFQKNEFQVYMMEANDPVPKNKIKTRNKQM